MSELHRWLKGMKANWSVGFTLFGLPFLMIFAFLTFDAFRSKRFLDRDLVYIDGTVSKAENLKGHRRDVDLLFSLQGDSVHYRSDLPYPSAFRYGSLTADRLTNGSPVTLTLNRSEVLEEPKRHRIDGYQWREIVGLRSGGVVHLDPREYERWHTRNQSIGRILFPFLCAISIYLMSMGSRRKRRNSQPGATDNPDDA